MVKLSPVILAAAITALFFASGTKSKNPPSGTSNTAGKSEVDSMIQAIDDLWFGGPGVRANVEMEVVAKTQRTLEMEYCVEGPAKTRIKILKPESERAETLKAEGKTLTYVTNIGVVMSVTPALMSQSWMGSHFTHGDLARTNRLGDGYLHQIVERQVVGQREIVKIQSTAAPQAPVPWSKIVSRFNRTLQLPEDQEFYDDTGTLVRRFEYRDVRKFGTVVVPASLTVRPMQGDKVGQRTELRFKSLERPAVFDQDFFSVNSFRRKK